jgi:hypothetical protein
LLTAAKGLEAFSPLAYALRKNIIDVKRIAGEELFDKVKSQVNSTGTTLLARG